MALKNWIRRLSVVVLFCLLLQSVTPITDVWARETASAGWSATNDLSQSAQSELDLPGQLAGPGYEPSHTLTPGITDSSVPVLGKPRCHDPGDTASTSDQEDTCKDGKKGGSQITYDTRALNQQEIIGSTGLPLIVSYDSQYETRPLPLFAHIPTGQAIDTWQIRIQGWTFDGTGARSLAFWDTTDKNTGRAVSPGLYYFEHTYKNKTSTGSTSHPVVVKKQEDGPLGYAWAHNFQAQVVKADEQHLIVKAFGKWSVFTYNRARRVFEASTKQGGTIAQQADGSWIWDRNGADGSGVSGVVRFDAKGLCTGYEDRVGNQVRQEYDSQGRLIRVIDQAGWSLQLAYEGNHISKVTDATGQNWNLSYNNGDLVQVENGLGHKWRFAYDTAHRMVQKSDPRGNTTKYAYDAEGRITTVTDPIGAIMAFDTKYFTEPLLDEDPANVEPAMGITTVTYRTAENKETGREQYTFNGGGHITRKELTPNGGNTIYAWIYQWGAGEDAGRLLSVTDPKGRVTQYGYESNTGLVSTATTQKRIRASWNYRTPTPARPDRPALGWLVSSALYRGNLAYEFEYDAQGVAQRVSQGDLEYRMLRARSEPGIKGLTSSLVWNWDGRGDPDTAPGARIIRYEYNQRGQPTSVVDAIGRKTTLAYDNAGRLAKLTNAAGRTTSFEYNVAGYLVKQVDAAGGETKYAYDESGNLAEVTDAKGNKTAYTFDGKNRLISRIDALGRISRLGYDNQGNLIWREDARGARVNLSYDGLGRAVKITFPTGEVWDYTYDASGMVTKASGPGVTWDYEYNDDDQVTKATLKQGSRLVSLSYKYDNGGRVSEVSTSDGYQITYVWGGYGQLERINSPMGVVDYNYEVKRQFSPVLTSIRTDRVTANFSYDPAGRLTEVIYKHQQWPASRAISHRYTYDQVDNVLSLQDATGTTAYKWDNLNQIVGVTYADGKSITYAYDAVGNRTKKTGPQNAMDYTYDAGNQMLSAGETKYNYDASGFLIAAWQGQKGINYHWDYQGQLKGVSQRQSDSLPYPLSLAAGTPAAETKARYAYDALGQQISRQVGSQETGYVVDRDHAIQETGPNGKPLSRSVYGPNYDELRATSQGADNEPLAPIAGSTGTITGAIDRQGNTRFAARYDPFGAPLEREGNSPLPGFQGRPYDSATGLYNFRARYYDAEAGRFISPDPVTSPYIPGTLNGYSFGMNNPLRYTDPTGKLLFLVPIIAGVAIGASYYSSSYVFSFHTPRPGDWLPKSGDFDCFEWSEFGSRIAIGGMIGGLAAAAAVSVFYIAGAALPAYTAGTTGAYVVTAISAGAGKFAGGFTKSIFEQAWITDRRDIHFWPAFSKGLGEIGSMADFFGF